MQDVTKCGCGCDFGALPRRKVLLGAGAAAASAFLPASARAKPAGDVYRSLWTDPRSISIYRKETGEGGEFEYWRDGRLQLQAWFALLKVLRDVDANVVMHFDPRVVDIVWAVQEWCYRDSGKRLPFRCSDGARTEATNRKIPGAAPASVHKQGKALDGRLEGLGVANFAKGALFFGMGGVGLYKSHVHVDCDAVRKWGGL